MSDDEDLPAVTEERDRRVAGWARTIEEDIITTIADIRRSWADLAACLYEFHKHKAWTALGYSSLEEWLAGPDIDLGRRAFFQLVETFRELHVQRGIELDDIARVDMSKAQVVLPAVRRQQVDPMDALSDAQVLTREDLREKYRAILPTDPDGNPPAIIPDTFHYERCPTCGHTLRVADAQ